MSSLYGAMDDLSSDHDDKRLTISVGRIVDTNDPLQMGRVRVFIPGLDRDSLRVIEVPFAIYCSPMAGHQQIQSRGPEDNVYTSGPVAYGLFSIPKVGTDVLVGFLNGDPTLRFWFGALYGISLTGTLPHGRYTFNNPKSPVPGALDGPLSAAEQPIQPLYENLTTAYTRTTATASNDGGINLNPRKNFEWRVRGADYQAAALGNIQKNLSGQVISSLADDRNYKYTEEDGTLFKNGDYTQGYAKSRVEPKATYDESLVDGGENLDPQTYSWTTPGFSSISMDDRPENARIRLRTGSGHQIILDDTNERIYISTVEGNNWIEMDQSGNIDIYAARRVSIHSAMDVNITTDGTFRVNAKQGIHLDSEQEVRITSKQDTHIKSYSTLRAESSGDTNIQSGGDTNISTGKNLNASSTGNVNINAIGVGAWTTGSSLNLSAGSNILMTATEIDMNGATAATAAVAAVANASDAYFTNRVPEHEPWGRIMMAQGSTDNNSGNSFVLQLSYTDPNVGRVELGDTITRNSRWHR